MCFGLGVGERIIDIALRIQRVVEGLAVIRDQRETFLDACREIGLRKAGK